MTGLSDKLGSARHKIELRYAAAWQVIRDKSTTVSRGFAFVTYMTAAAAANAIQSMNGRHLGPHFVGRALKVGPSHRRG